MYDLNGKIAIVTGAGGRHGIGRAIAVRLAQEGANVVVTDVQRSTDAMRAEDREAGWRGLPSVVEEIQDLGREALGLFSDVSDASQVNDMVKQTIDRFGRIDILVNNAGSQPGRDRVLVVDLEEDAFDEVMRVNVKGTYLCSQAVARHMIERGGGGKIIIISSGAGQAGPGAVRCLLRLQVRLGRVHPVIGPGTGRASRQRQRYLPRLGGHRADRLYRRGIGPGRGSRRKSTGP